MAQLIVRQLEDSIVRKLRTRAAEAGVSVEEEHRRILRETLLKGHGRHFKSFREHLLSIPTGGEDLLIERKRTTTRHRTRL